MSLPLRSPRPDLPARPARTRAAVHHRVGRVATTLLLLAATLNVPTLHAEETAPAAPMPITLMVDARDLDRRIFTVHETLPVRAGALTLWYPQWLPGTHSPSGPLVQLGGLRFSANGKSLEWTRDPLDVFAFHLDIPAGVQTLDADFQFLSPVEEKEGRITATPEIVGVQWNTVVLYPKGVPARALPVAAALRLPAGWQYGTALSTVDRATDTVHFAPVSLEQLVDSPVFAGRYFRRIDLDPGAAVPVHLDLVADRAASLDASAEQIAVHRKLVQQAYALFGARHYTHYDFLLALTDEFGRIGLEHHQSSENAEPPDYFTEWVKTAPWHDLLSHEFTHSWNGKFRRPADLDTPDFNVPMQNSLLWVYEGQTQYWGCVLAARSGLMPVEMVRDAIAATAATFAQREGRSWRALQDTTNDPIINRRRPIGWLSWQRSEDYYSEGELIWLDADTLIRERSGGKRSLDDFAHRFFGIDDGVIGPKPYRFEDVVAALDAVEHADWAAFLRSRLDGHGPGAPLDGLARSGWKLSFSDKPTDFFKGQEELRKQSDYSYSIGLSLEKDGKIGAVQWNGPAFKAGITVGATLLAVNGRAYKPELMKAVIGEARHDPRPIELLLKIEDRYSSVQVDYHDGLRYPRLERVADTPDRLSEILSPRR